MTTTPIASNSIRDELINIFGTENVLTQDITPELTHDESLTASHETPLAVVFPTDEEQLVNLIRLAKEKRFSLVPRGSGSGMSGACNAIDQSVVVSFSKMNKILEIDLENHMAIIEPGVTLIQLNEELAKHSLIYPVQPGESSATIGGNAATNAGGMKAVRYGVTRNHILGMHVILENGDKLVTGGKFLKSSTGYDLTQLFIGSEGTLGLFSQLTLKLSIKFKESVTVLSPFKTLKELTEAIPRIINTGVMPSILEYLDFLAIDATTRSAGIDLGIPETIKSSAQAYLLIVLEGNDSNRLEQDLASLGEILDSSGALDIYSLPPTAGTAIVDAREKAFWVAKAMHANDIIDVVVPRSTMANYLDKVGRIAQESGSLIAGCGHVGDGNVHLSVFQSDPNKLHEVMYQILKLGTDLGGAVSGEHGIGTEKLPYFAKLENEVKLRIQRQIKATLDPTNLFNPGHLIP
jgi:glycolate oxidase